MTAKHGRFWAAALVALAAFLCLFGSDSGTATLTAAESGAESEGTGTPDETAAQPSVAGKTLVVPFRGVIIPADNWLVQKLVSGPAVTDTFVREALERARRDGAELIVLEIDSPGGVVDTCNKICRMLIDSPIPTVALVTKDAISGASMVATACDEIVMVTGTTIGDCEPHMINSELPDYMREKIETAIRARMRANAEAHGYPGKVLEAMVTKSITLYRVTFEDEAQEFLTGEELELLESQIESGESDRAIADRKLVVGDDRLLTLTAGEAVEYGLANEVVGGTAQFYKDRGIGSDEQLLHKPPQMVRQEMDLAWNMLLVLCLVIGIAGAIVEAGVPGFGVPGVVGIIGFACFFIILVGHGRADTGEVLLFAAGVALILVEIFLIPGFGVAGILGILCLAGSFILALLPPFDSELMERDWQGEVENTILVLGVGGALAVGLGWVLATFAQRIPLVRRIILAGTLRSGRELRAEAEAGRAERYPHEAEGEHAEADLKGVEGVAGTVLRPSGKMRTDDGRSLDVVSDGAMIPQGERIRVVEVNGPRITVARIESEDGPA